MSPEITLSPPHSYRPEKGQADLQPLPDAGAGEGVPVQSVPDPQAASSKCLTRWPSPRGRWRSGFKTGAWSGRKSTTKTSSPAAKRNKSKLRGKRGARSQKNSHQEKRTRRLPVIPNSLLTIKKETFLQSSNCNVNTSLRFKTSSVDTQMLSNTKPVIYSIYCKFALLLFPNGDYFYLYYVLLSQSQFCKVSLVCLSSSRLLLRLLQWGHMR